MNGKNIAVLGLGSWGMALAAILNDNGCGVRIYGRDAQKCAELSETRRSHDYLPEFRLPDEIGVSTDMEFVLKGADAVVVAVPSQAVRSVTNAAAKLISKNPVIISAAKGLEVEISLRMSEVISQTIPDCRFVALSGPCHAEEAAKKLPSSYVAASNDADAANFAQDIFFSNYFRMYTNSDLIGVEIGAALKNVIALAAGVSDGLGFGDNAKAALMTRGIAEIARLGVAMGARTETFAGLTGIGDLIVTCTSMHSRNRRAGILLGQGKSLEETLTEVKMVVEGVTTAKAAMRLAEKYNVDMPIIQEMNNALFGDKNMALVAASLMGREKRSEDEEKSI
jgi:glycerol-3-phosphate dehydrogenase (NAD(P)+)